MSAEMMNCLIGIISLLAGYFARHLKIALPGVSIPPAQPAPAPAVVPSIPVQPGQPVANFDPIIQQLLAHQMALIQQLKMPSANGVAVNSPAPSPASAS